jgi:cytochrome P450
MPDIDAIPTAPGAAPLLGHLPRLLRDPMGYLDSLGERGGLFTVRLGPKKMVVVCDPTLTHEVLVADEVFDKGGPLFEAGLRTLPSGIGMVPHSSHRRIRKLIQPSFTRVRVAGYGEIMSERITAAVAGWRDGAELDVNAEMVAITSRVLLATMFSSSLSERTMQQITADSNELISGIMADAATPSPLRRLPTPRRRRYRNAVARLRETMLALVAERRAEGSAGAERADALSALLASVDDAGADRLSESELVDQLVFLMVAGTEATAQTVAWALHEVSKRPELEVALQAEADEVLGGRPAGYDDIPRLAVAGRILLEVLRFHSPSWIFTRRTNSDTELGGHRIPAGTDVVYSPYLINRAPLAHEEPRSFDPERWQPERATSAHREGYIPFGNGARKCVGDQYAMTEATLILATIASRWSLAAVPGNRIRPRLLSMSVGPDGLKLRATARERR